VSGGCEALVEERETAVFSDMDSPPRDLQAHPVSARV
jgi:hypothetical protein